MMSSSSLQQVKDPVCGMQVDPHQYAITFQQMHFAFCSQQCKVRFLAHPHLYIGYPGRKAPRQEGVSVLKRRRIFFAMPLSEVGSAMLAEALRMLMGVKEVSVTGESLEIVYDLIEISAAEIEQAVAEAGVQLGVGWAERLRRAFIHESEESEIESLKVAPPR